MPNCRPEKILTDDIPFLISISNKKLSSLSLKITTKATTLQNIINQFI